MKPTLILALLFAACSRQEKPHGSLAVSVLKDITDSTILSPMANPILALMDFNNHKNDSYTFRYQTISDLRLSHIIDISLEDESTTSLQNKNNIPLHREKLLVRLADSIKNTISNNVKQTASSTLPFSECFRTICSEVNYLRKLNYKRTILLTFSDLAENSEIFSCFTEEAQSLPTTLTNDAIKAFEASNLLEGNYDNLFVVLVHKPLNRNDDRRFDLLSKAYVELFSKHRIKVTIQAHKNSFQL